MGRLGDILSANRAASLGGTCASCKHFRPATEERPSHCNEQYHVINVPTAGVTPEQLERPVSELTVKELLALLMCRNATVISMQVGPDSPKCGRHALKLVG
jgi:hypothetical protein